MPGLGRKHAPDPRDHRHLLANVLPAVVPPRPVRKIWRVWWRGNQGDTGQCVGYSLYCLLRALPHLQREPSPLAIYDRAQVLDEFDDTPPEEGTSVRAGAKALKEFGKFTTYGWAFTVEDAINWMGEQGPTVWGINWYEGMDDPDPLTGLVTVRGAIRGGHAVCCLGYDDRKEWLIFQNSWSTKWGLRGRFKLRYTDAARLLEEDGEVCSPTES